MKKITIVLMMVCSIANAQTASDLFNKSDQKISWLGIDYSHVKLIGDFNQFFGAGEHSAVDIRDEYFNRWNSVILSEPDKYDVRSMLRKTEVFYDVEMINEINSTCSVEDLEDNNVPNYSAEQISEFIAAYPIENKEGIGVLMIAEAYNKYGKEAYHHIVILNMSTKEILIHERIRTEPTGFGLRNYWAGSIYRAMKLIEGTYYKKWKAKYK